MYTTRALIRKANKLWNVPYVPAEINRANKKKWINAVIQLGDKWLIAKNIPRPEEPPRG